MAEKAPRAARLGDDAAVVHDVLRFGESPTTAWRYLPEDTRIAAIERTSDGRTAILEDLGEGTRKLTLYKEGRAGESFTGEAAITEMGNISRAKIGAGSSDEVSFIHASRIGEKVQLVIGKRNKEVSVSELQDLIDDPQIASPKFDEFFNAAATDKTEFIVYRDALTRRPDRFGGSLKAGTIDDPMRLAVALRERYPGRRIYLDDEVDLAKENQRSIAPLRGPADLGVLAPEEGLIDHDFLKKIKPVLESAGIHVFSTPQGMEGIPNILFISGHNDANLVNYLTTLGKQGVFKGKVLILNTCFAVDNPNLAHDLIHSYGAKGVYLHTEKIKPLALQPVMNELAEVLSEAKAAGRAIHPADMLDLASERALNDRSLSERLKNQIKLLKRGLMQISMDMKSKGSQIGRTPNASE